MEELRLSKYIIIEIKRSCSYLYYYLKNLLLHIRFLSSLLQL